MKLAARRPPYCTLILHTAVLLLLLSATIVKGLHERHIQGIPFWCKARRMLIGSTMPTCTYNECRGCKNKCIAEQIPVEGNDPINSSYHYRCVCKRSS